jgi:spermidine/putrescine transport system permease protein
MSGEMASASGDTLFRDSGSGGLPRRPQAPRTVAPWRRNRKGLDARDLWRFPGARAAAYAVIAYLYIPILVLVVLSFNASDSSLARWQGFTTHWYAMVAADNNMMSSIWSSLIVASCAAPIGTVIATLAALGTTRTRFRGKLAIEALIGLPLIVPDIVAAIAILLLFVMIGIKLGLVSLVLAHTVFAIPIAYLPIRARLEGLDPSLAEAAADLYATPWQSLRRIILPLIWPGILSGAMLAFIGSLGDVVISYFVSGPGSTTLPVYVFSMVRMGVTPTVNAVSALLVGASVSLLTLSYLLGRRSG